MDPIIGIDLGTTNSAAAWLSDDGPRLIPNVLGETLTPSVVGVDRDGHVLVGAAARELRVTHPERCASLFKRQMGSEWTAELAGRTYSPEELSSLVLSSLKSDAEEALKMPVRRAVITVPAYFNDRQRKATIAAGVIAGFEVERILNEPTAAALAYGFHENRDEKILLIFDLGGGTFDVSIVEVFDGTIEVRASAGESFLGGEDFTRSLAAHVLKTRGQSFERAEMQAPVQIARLIQQCEIAKRRLTAQDAVDIRLPDREGALPAESPVVPVTRAQFELATAPMLARIELPIRRVLADARIARDDIGEVVLVGGATRMPSVARRVREYLGREPQKRLNPDEVVALGAAVQAALFARSAVVEDLVVTDVAPFTLGVEIVKQLGPERRTGYFLPIIERNTTIPVSRVNRVSTVEPNQPAIKVRVFQGDARRVEDNLFLGEFELTGIPRGPAGQDIDIRFTYDLNGILEVEAAIVKTGKSIAHVITKHARGMTPEQVKSAVRELARLKRHPREETANRFLLRRAERVYQELAIDERALLSQLLDGFEEALNLQDPASIESNRSALSEFLNRLDGTEGAAAE